MKAQAFLELVSAMRYEQASFFAKRQAYPIEARKHLIQAKELEKRVDAVVKEGKLEPDNTCNVMVLDEQEERQLCLDLEKEYADRMEEDDEDEEISD